MSGLWNSDYDQYTLRRIADRGFALAFECRHCRHVNRCDISDLIGRHGATMSIAELRSRAVCTYCKRRRADILLRQAGLRGNLAWWPHPPRATRD